jgi:hypothetical protein
MPACICVADSWLQLPAIMLKFIRRFPKWKNKVVLMNTRAGMLIGKFITPGLTGIAFYLSALILFLKGFQ